MAGKSERFFNAGYTDPKWKLLIHGRPLLDYIIYSFKTYLKNEKFIFIYMGDSSISDFISERAELLGINQYSTIGLDKYTSGQAETVYKGLKNQIISSDDEIIIFNADTIRKYVEKPIVPHNCDGWIECFLGQGDHWSFVFGDALKKEGIALQVAEKKRISNLCSTGLYWFSSWEVFLNSYKSELLHPQARELFVAPLFQNIINKNGVVRYSIIKNDEIYFSGTPIEYHVICNDLRLLKFFE